MREVMQFQLGDGNSARILASDWLAPRDIERVIECLRLHASWFEADARAREQAVPDNTCGLP